MTTDTLFRDQLQHVDPPAPAIGTPGKRSLTSSLAGRPQVVFRVSFGDGVADGAEHAVERAATSSGQPLPSDLRGRFEASTGADLSAVRIHTGGESAEASRAVGAKAYATGQDIHFAEGHYDPSSAFGVHLIAHEVAHTVQQQGASPTRQHKLEVSAPQDAAEVEADRAADAMVRGQPAELGGHAPSVARQPADPAPAADPAAAPAAAAHDLTPEEKGRLDNAVQLMERAATSANAAIDALKDYGTKGAAALTSIESSFQSFINVYDVQFRNVKLTIQSAQATNVLQQSVIFGALAAITGPIVSGIAGSELEIASRVKDITAAYAKQPDFVGIGKAAAQGAAGDLGLKSGGGAGAAGEDSVGKKLEFWKSFAQLQASSTRLVGLAADAAKINGAIGKVTQAIDSAKDTKKASGAYPPLKIEDDAARLEDGTRALAAAAPGIDAALKRMTDSEAKIKALKADDKEVEKTIWINWVGSLPPGEAGTNGILDHDQIENRLKTLGIWTQLGIDVGMNLSDNEEALAICSGKAVARVLAAVGTEVSVNVVANVVAGDVTIPGLPTISSAVISGLPPPKEDESDGKELSPLDLLDKDKVKKATRSVKAKVSGAHIKGVLDSALLGQVDHDKQRLVDLLFTKGLVVVELQGVADEPTA